MFASGKTATVSSVANYIEDVFSTYLFTGTGSDQTIVNNIDLATYGGLLWYKGRNIAASHSFRDSARGTQYSLSSNTTAAQTNPGVGSTVFNTNGWTQGLGGYGVYNYASWTFRKQPKFFDVVTYTGDGTNNRAISHNLGSTPGSVIVKCTSAAAAWPTWHRSLGGSNYNMYLNLTGANGAQGDFSSDGSASFTSTTFPVSNGGLANTSGATYVAYIFAHNAGGFGLTGTDNVISCGSWTQTASGATVTLGYEPQWLLLKSSSGANNWRIIDNMRGMTTSNSDQVLVPNTTDAETAETGITPTATGFNVSTYFGTTGTFIYIAIRRGPMKVPTSGTSVYTGITRTGNGSLSQIDSGIGFAPDTALLGTRNYATDKAMLSRLQGNDIYMNTTSTDAEITTGGASFTETTGTFNIGNGTGWKTDSGRTYIDWYFGRAPSFFDEVCYTGDNAFNRAIPHNLAAVPELVITKVRSTTANWAVYCSTTGLGYPMALNTTAAASANPYVWGTTAPTSTNFYIGDDTRTNGGGFTYVSYLFATCQGVSKVGSYTGNGSSQTINCGFTGGARFVLIKRTDSTGSWFVWDTSRGMVAGTDPRLPLNATTAETNANWVYTATGGFQIVTTDANVNASGGTYIFLAIA